MLGYTFYMQPIADILGMFLGFLLQTLELFVNFLITLLTMILNFARSIVGLVS